MNHYSEILKKQSLSPHQVFVDLNIFDENARRMAVVAEKAGLPIRIATKSLRVPELILRALNSSPVYQGLMCYSCQEAFFLAEQGFDDFLIAYPSVANDDLEALSKILKLQKKICLVIDSREHANLLEKFFAQTNQTLDVLLEVDLSLRLGPVVVGVRRSPLHTEQQILNLIAEIKKYPHIRFHGLMAYEAHVAGVGDRNPFKPLLNLLLKPLRKFSAKKIALKRALLSESLKKLGVTDFIFNGGGTGSLSFNQIENKVLTEMTAGSGFYCPQLFDYYSNLHLKASAFFSLQVVRKPEEGWFTCLGGGYVASGEPGWDRIAQPIEAKLSAFEATGEVQTPIQTAENLKIGDSVIFRHSKAGEVMERFNEVVLIENNKVLKNTKTYRGFGKCFI